MCMDRVKIAEARAIEVVVAAMKARAETKSSCTTMRANAMYLIYIGA